MRSSIIAKVGVATAAVVAATGGLAAANALPAPIQDAASHFGIASPHHDDHPTAFAPDATTTTTEDSSAIPPEVSPASTNEPPDNHGGEVSGVAHETAHGCEHGPTVSNVASDGRSENDAVDAPEATDSSGHDDSGDECPTPTTTETVSPNGGDHNGEQPDGDIPHAGDGTSGDHHGDGSGDATTSTTVAAGHDGSGDHSSEGTDTNSGGGGSDSHDGGSSDGSATSGSGD